MPTKEFKYQGETFTLDDSKSCLIEITHAEDPSKKGWAGVNVGEGDKNYPYATTLSEGSFNEKGVTIANGGRSETVQESVEQCCKLILREMERDGFPAKEYCAKLQAWVDEQP